ncbi:MAG: hypothetical protein H6660_11030 [Ardenticatenaceae bacterium]|nr:hypothetical protein [Ardenticatenaceae bacterium]
MPIPPPGHWLSAAYYSDKPSLHQLIGDIAAINQYQDIDTLMTDWDRPFFLQGAEGLAGSCDAWQAFLSGRQWGDSQTTMRQL